VAFALLTDREHAIGAGHTGAFEALEPRDRHSGAFEPPAQALAGGSLVPSSPPLAKRFGVVLVEIGDHRDVTTGARYQCRSNQGQVVDVDRVGPRAQRPIDRPDPLGVDAHCEIGKAAREADDLRYRVGPAEPDHTRSLDGLVAWVVAPALTEQRHLLSRPK
jgi:hypothetical protein